MEENNSGCTKFVIDGFPRSEENRTAWESILGPSCTLEFVLYFNCPEEVMTQRLVSVDKKKVTYHSRRRILTLTKLSSISTLSIKLKRGETSGRVDDKLDIIKKRFETAQQESLPIVQYYANHGKLRTVHADNSVDNVFVEVSALFEALKA